METDLRQDRELIKHAKSDERNQTRKRNDMTSFLHMSHSHSDLFVVEGNTRPYKSNLMLTVDLKS